MKSKHINLISCHINFPLSHEHLNLYTRAGTQKKKKSFELNTKLDREPPEKKRIESLKIADNKSKKKNAGGTSETN